MLSAILGCHCRLVWISNTLLIIFYTKSTIRCTVLSSFTSYLSFTFYCFALQFIVFTFIQNTYTRVQVFVIIYIFTFIEQFSAFHYIKNRYTRVHAVLSIYVHTCTEQSLVLFLFQNKGSRVNDTVSTYLYTFNVSKTHAGGCLNRCA